MSAKSRTRSINSRAPLELTESGLDQELGEDEVPGGPRALEDTRSRRSVKSSPRSTGGRRSRSRHAVSEERLASNESSGSSDYSRRKHGSTSFLVSQKVRKSSSRSSRSSEEGRRSDASRGTRVLRKALPRSSRSSASSAVASRKARVDAARSRSSSGKSRRRRQEAERPPAGKDDELPIAEILKSSDEQRTKYQEPAPLPELTTHTVYYIGRHGFNAMRVGKKQNGKARKLAEGEMKHDVVKYRPVGLAVGLQSFWVKLGLLVQGLLGGLGLLHLVVLRVYFEEPEHVPPDYNRFAESFAGLFTLFVTLSVLAILDKLDLLQLSARHARELFKHHSLALLALPIYFAALTAHQFSLRSEGRLAVYFNNVTLFTMANDSRADLGIEEFLIWKKLSLSKDALAVAGWLIVAIGCRRDMLLEYLKLMADNKENVE